MRSAPGPTLCGRNAAPPHGLHLLRHYGFLPFLSFCKKPAVPHRIRVHPCPSVVEKTRTCCAPRLDPPCAAGMPPLRMDFNCCVTTASFPSFPSVKKLRCLTESVFIRVHRGSKIVRTCCAPRIHPPCAAGMPPLHMDFTCCVTTASFPSFPSVKKHLRTHPCSSVSIVVQKSYAPVALRAYTHPVRQECRPSAWTSPVASPRLPSLPFLL